MKSASPTSRPWSVLEILLYFIILKLIKLYLSQLDDDRSRVRPSILHILLGRISDDENHGRRSGPVHRLCGARLRHSRGRRDCDETGDRRSSETKVSASDHQQFCGGIHTHSSPGWSNDKHSYKSGLRF